MDYEKLYKEALERAKKELNTCGSQDCDAARQIYRFFPKLKESEDERIRKWLIKLLSTMQYHHCDEDREMGNKALAWLEKQGEKLPAGFYYVNSEGEKFYSEKFKYGNVVLGIEKPCSIDNVPFVGSTNTILTDSKKPINDTDEEIVEVVKDTSILDMVEQKPAWSEEDEKAIGIIKMALEHPYDMEGKWDRKFTLDWLKSLKERYTWKPSDEQIECICDAIKHYQTNGYPATKLNELYEQMSKIYKL